MKLASIERINKIVPHPNADLLEIVCVLGYQSIVKKNVYKTNELICFIQPDTVLPDTEWAKIYKAKSNRVKAIKLRKEWSFGIVESITLLPIGKSVAVDDGKGNPVETQFPWEEGDEVSQILGITKYEPPAPQDLNAKGNLPFGLGKTDESRYQNIDDLPFGQIVDVTLKVDGSSLTVFCKKVDQVLDYVTGITSRSLELKPDCDNKYTQVVKKYNLIDKLKAYCNMNNVNLALRGEMYGNNIQGFASNPHATRPLGFALFNVFNLDTLQYEGTDSPHYYEKVADALGIETVPMIEKGVVLTPELIKKYDEAIDTINGVPFEGVVIKMAGGKSFKVINKSYDSKK
jgi:RNA ligase (TIGR02306 family)